MSSQTRGLVLIAVTLSLALLGTVWGVRGVVQGEALPQNSISTPSSTPDSVTATRITNKSTPFMDGVLEPIWQTAGKLTFPISEERCWSPDIGKYNRTDPSAFTVYYLHDGYNLYIAIQTTNDRTVESSDDDQSSDGLAGLAIERKDDPGNPYSMFRLMWYQDPSLPGGGPPIGPPIDRDRMVYDALWRRYVLGSTWNKNDDTDKGYVFEFFIPLRDPVRGSKLGLGGWRAGDYIKTNIVLVDHDGNPGASHLDAAFRKCWWGKDSPEDFSDPRWIFLSDADPIGEPGDDKTVTAQRIKSSVAPVIDGIPDEPIWQQGGTLRFPNSLGQFYNPHPRSQAPYNTDDPSSYTLYFFHDDTYLYVAAKSDDRKIEAAEYNEAADGLTSLVFEGNGGGSDRRYSTFWHKLDLWERHQVASPITDCDGEKKTEVDLHFHQGPPSYPYDTEHVNWGPWGPTLWKSRIPGTWNNKSDLDAGYAFEYKVPLDRLGGYGVGERIPANIVLIDHDDNPNGRFDDPYTHFEKFWWGFDGNEFYPPVDGNPGPRRDIHPEEERYVFLDNGDAYGDDDPLIDQLGLAARAAKAVQYIANSQLVYSGLIRSFPDEMAAHTYDLAVALIALTDAGKQAEAQMLAEAMISIMEMNGDEGFFYDSYNVVDRIVSQGTASGTGPNTWAAFALAYYGKTYDAQNALAAADKVAQWIINKLYDPKDGGVWGGICHPFEERPEDNHQNDVIFDFKSTEQVIDTWHLFRIMGYDFYADAVKSWLTTDGKGWVEIDPGPVKQDKRFSTGVNPVCGQDTRLFLDPQSWGSIVANMVRERDKANGAIDAAETRLREDIIVDGQSVSGFRDNLLEDEVIWYEGTSQMIVAYVYKEDEENARFFLGEMGKVQNRDGSWNHSSGDYQKLIVVDCHDYPTYHVAKPHIAATAWNYFALRDVEKSKRLPYLLDVCGDQNDDDKVDVFDVIIDLRIAVGIIQPMRRQLMLSDLNQDKVINVFDAIIGLQHIVGLAEVAGCGPHEPGDIFVVINPNNVRHIKVGI